MKVSPRTLIAAIEEDSCDIICSDWEGCHHSSPKGICTCYIHAMALVGDDPHCRWVVLTIAQHLQQAWGKSWSSCHTRSPMAAKRCIQIWMDFLMYTGASTDEHHRMDYPREKLLLSDTQLRALKSSRSIWDYPWKRHRCSMATMIIMVIPSPSGEMGVSFRLLPKLSSADVHMHKRACT